MMQPTSARQILVNVISNATAAGLTTAVNTFLAGLGEATLVSVQFAASDTEFAVTIVYSK